MRKNTSLKISYKLGELYICIYVLIENNRIAKVKAIELILIHVYFEGNYAIQIVLRV